VLALSTDSLDDLRGMAEENEVSEVPLLSDSDASVSQAYDVLGRGMHADKPGHTFILIDRQGVIQWREDYSEMYVPTEDVLKAVRKGLAGG
jgi:peroxiredoxin